MVTSLFSVAILIFTWQALSPYMSVDMYESKNRFKANSIRFDVYKHYFLPYFFKYATVFAYFMLLNFRWVPRLLDKAGIQNTLMAMIGCLLVLWAVHIAADGYIKAYVWVQMEHTGKAFAHLWQHNLIYTLWLAFAFATYTLVKYGGLLLLQQAALQEGKVPLLLQFAQLQLWLLIGLSGLLMLFFAGQSSYFLVWIMLWPLFIVYYHVVYYKWLPHCLQLASPRWQYTKRVVLWATVFSFLAGLLIAGFSGREEAGAGAGIFAWFAQVIVGAPALWYWYHYRQKQHEDMKTLQQQLGQSTAQLDQLRTQINPHFLFNALNTVYGLALIEKAEQTADAIEKISEMMRFMLRQNQEAFIPLEKDIDYLKNYISIQQMRMGSHAPLQLLTELPTHLPKNLNIAPMLLIPFVENAFKHGCSMQAPSHIRLVLQLDGNKLFFQLHNSVHDRPWLQDPEKDNHGIGLQNVKQRLALLYPDRHLLHIVHDAHTYTTELTLIL